LKHPRIISNSHFRIFLFFIAGALFISCGTGKSLQRELKKEFSGAEADQHWFRGIMIYDPTAEEVVFEHNSHKYFTPASTTKLFSFYAGLKLLNDSIPALKFGTRNDTLYFKGTGDPSFLHREFDSSEILRFFRSHSGELVLISPEASEKAFAPGWAWEDYNYAFAAERSDFPIYGNLVSFRISPDAPGIEVRPTFFRSMVEPDSVSSSKRVKRELLKNNFKLPIFDTSAFEQDVPFIYSPELAAKLLADTLGRKVSLQNKTPQGLRLRETIYSIPADSLYKRMLQESDNFLAEQLLLVAAGEIGDTLQAQKTISFMKEQHLQDLPDDIKWLDGSGLSRYNLFTPRSLVKLLDKIYKEVPRERLFDLLPAGGVSGTLKNNYHAPVGASPFIFAKTGTLSNNHSLSGFLITKKGKILIFSFMNSNYLVPTAMVKAHMDMILRNIYLNY
jgi:serine-type D-Ala-D-Ala carboxypeptidase/endopeptidase (penicillin-binding protein 4)